jgi:hypothetical protein
MNALRSRSWWGILLATSSRAVHPHSVFFVSIFCLTGQQHAGRAKTV